MRRRDWTFWLPALVVAVGTAAQGEGGSWTDRARGSSLVVVARCESAASDWEDGAIHTRSDITVLSVLRGTPDHTTTVRQPGGVVDGIGQRVSHVSLLEPGGTYLLFLSRDDAGGWAPTLRGVNPVDTGAEGEALVGGERLESVISALGSGR